MKKRSLSAIAIAAASVVALAGCGGGQSPATTTDTIRTSLVGIPTTLDPARGNALPDYLLSRMMFDTLLRLDQSGELIGGLATEWESTPTSVTFTLRDGATCADETPITPTVVKASLDYMASPEVVTPVFSLLYGPGNAPTVTADDAANTVTVELANPWPNMTRAFTIANTGIICPAGLADLEGLASGQVQGAGSGPYVLSASEVGVSYTYTLRDDYDAWPVYPEPLAGVPAETVDFQVAGDSASTANLVLTGGIDVGAIQADSVDRFTGNEQYNVSIFPFSDMYLVFNERPGSVFADQGLRTAVAQAIDRTAFESVTSQGNGIVSENLSVEGTQCWASADGALIDLDPDAAAAALDGVTIRMVGAQVVGPGGAGNEYIQEVLRATGATVELDNLDVGGWISTLYGQPNAWDLTVFADLNAVASLSNPLTFFVGPPVEEGGSNLGAVTDPSVGAAFDAALAATDESSLCEGYVATSKAIVGGAHAVPLVNDPYIYVSRSGFQVTIPTGALDDHILRIVG